MSRIAAFAHPCLPPVNIYVCCPQAKRDVWGGPGWSVDGGTSKDSRCSPEGIAAAEVSPLLLR